VFHARILPRKAPAQACDRLLKPLARRRHVKRRERKERILRASQSGDQDCGELS